MVKRLDDYRLDVDEAMGVAQASQLAEAQRNQTIDVWKRIERQMLTGKGPIAQLLMQFREDAVTSLSELVYADPNDAKAIAALQADVQRSLRTMEKIDQFHADAKAAEANVENDD